MEFRYDGPRDLKEIDRIWRQSYSTEFGLPDVSNKVISGVVDSEEGIRGFGIVKLFAEGIIILEQNQSTRDKREALYQLVEAQYFGCSKFGIQQVHAFVKDEKFAKILQKHFGYETVKEKCLVARIT